jgi:hypothetical protein
MLSIDFLLDPLLQTLFLPRNEEEETFFPLGVFKKPHFVWFEPCGFYPPSGLDLRSLFYVFFR